MSLLPITLGVKRHADAQGIGGKTKPLKKGQLKEKIQQTLERDQYTCRYCGFQSRQYQKAIPKDWAAGDYASAELVTACPFCEQCFALETVGPMASGALVWMPDISQGLLNHVMRAVYAAKAHGEAMPAKMRDCAQRALDVFTHAKGEAKRRIGTDDPAVLASVLLEGVEEPAYRKRADKLSGLRLMPLDRRIVQGQTADADQFPKMAQYWISADGPFGNIPPEKWESLASFAKAKTA
jgi:intracellular multiplication protein IcmJ